MRRTLSVSCLLAAAVLLAACSGSPGKEPTAPSVTVPAGPAPAATAEPSPPAGPEATTTPPAFSSAQLEAAVTAAKSSLGLGGEVLSEDALRAMLQDAGPPGPEVTFEPAACAQIAAADSVTAVQDAALAGLAYGSEAGAASFLNVAAYGGDSVLDTLDFIDEAVLSDCAEVRMSREGTTVTVRNTRLDVATTAEETLALETVVSSPAGRTQLVVLSARTGSVRLVASVPAPRDPQQAAGEAGLLIDAVLAELGLGSR